MDRIVHCVFGYLNAINFPPALVPGMKVAMRHIKSCRAKTEKPLQDKIPYLGFAQMTNPNLGYYIYDLADVIEFH
jgi:hypothetical protein